MPHIVKNTRENPPQKSRDEIHSEWQTSQNHWQSKGKDDWRESLEATKAEIILTQPSI